MNCLFQLETFVDLKVIKGRGFMLIGRIGILGQQSLCWVGYAFTPRTEGITKQKKG